eukprot:m.285872 g.285872  ORF g.285872 m.285872 type:complete len:128 (-) comp19917_c1_seq34:2397-2780(-)
MNYSVQFDLLFRICINEYFCVDECSQKASCSAPSSSCNMNTLRCDRCACAYTQDIRVPFVGMCIANDSVIADTSCCRALQQHHAVCPLLSNDRCAHLHHRSVLNPLPTSTSRRHLKIVSISCQQKTA